MPRAIAFLPWISVPSEKTISGMRLLPYKQKEWPGDLAYLSQQEIDSIFAAYSSHKGSSVRQATIVELEEWQSGQDVEKKRQSIFEAVELLKFCALSERKLFGRWDDYTNSDSYAFVIQGYSPTSPGTFSFICRRRDGQTTHFWSNNTFTFQKPEHAIAGMLNVDENLFAVLMANRTMIKDRIFSGIVDFNAANTDSSAIPVDIELVLMKAAFEWVLGISSGWEKLRDGLSDALSKHRTDKSSIRPLGQWSAIYPKSLNPLAAWAQEFGFLRGTAAHGISRTRSRRIWPSEMHLAFASKLFPLVVKSKLCDLGIYEFTSIERATLNRLEEYLAFSVERKPADGESHDWAKIDGDIAMREVGDRLLAEMRQELRD